MMEVHFRQAHRGNYRPAMRGQGQIAYLVIHSTAGGGENAESEAVRLARGVVSVSVHYLVDERAVWQAVRESDIAWHCGTRRVYFHPYCRNENSLGIALCSRLRDGRYSIPEETAARAAALVRRLMARYAIPADNVLRHYDVTHKTCPTPFVESAAAWQAFQSRLRADEPAPVSCL